MNHIILGNSYLIYGLMESVLKQLEHYNPTEADRAVLDCAKFFRQYGDGDPRLSQAASERLGRTILIGNMADLPYASPTTRFPNLSKDEINRREEALAAYAAKTFPDRRDFNEWSWRPLASAYESTGDYIRVNDPIPDAVPTCMEGNRWIKTAVIMLQDRRTTKEDRWRDLAALQNEDKFICPQDDQSAEYDFTHEVRHPMERRRGLGLPNQLRMKSELGADKSALYAVWTKAVQDGRNPITAVEPIIHSRAMGAFRAAYPYYWLALPLGYDEDITYRQALLAGNEIRFRIYAERTGMPLPARSEDIQALILKWQNSGPGAGRPAINQINSVFAWAKGVTKWSQYSPLETAIPALRWVMPQITDELTYINAEMVLAAAEYFRPDLKGGRNSQIIERHRRNRGITAEAA